MKNALDKINGVIGILAAVAAFLLWLTSFARGVVTEEQLKSAQKETTSYVDVRHAEVQKAVDEIKTDVKDTRKMIFELWQDNRRRK